MWLQKISPKRKRKAIGVFYAVLQPGAGFGPVFPWFGSFCLATSSWAPVCPMQSPPRGTSWTESGRIRSGGVLGAFPGMRVYPKLRPEWQSSVSLKSFPAFGLPRGSAPLANVNRVGTGPWQKYTAPAILYSLYYNACEAAAFRWPPPQVFGTRRPGLQGAGFIPP